MPTVRGRRYPYTPSGMRAARAAAANPAGRRRRPAMGAARPAMGAARPVARPVARPMRRPMRRRYV